MTATARVPHPPVSPTLAADPWRIVPARIVARRDECEGIFTLDLRLEDDADREGYGFAPGQFNMLYVHGAGESAISISSRVDRPEILSHTIHAVGQITHLLNRAPVGDVVGVRGPFGAPWPIDAAVGKTLAIAAGGVGLAPMRALLHEVARRREEFRRVVLFAGAKTPANLIYRDEFDAWSAAGVEVLATVDRPDADWRGHVGVVTSLFSKVRLPAGETVVMTCGPEIMMKHVVKESLAARVPKESIYVTMERNMKCACGFCGHCQLGPEFVCRDGPVFPFSRVERFFAREGF